MAETLQEQINKRESDYKKEIGQNLKFWRNVRGLKQKEFAELVNTKPNYIAQIESGHASVSIKALAKFSLILKVDIADLVTPIKFRDVLYDIWNDPKIVPRVTEEEFKELISIKFRCQVKSPEKCKNLYLSILDLYRAGRFSCDIFNQDENANPNSKCC